MCTQSSNYSPSSIPRLLDRKSIASFILYPYRSLITGARCVRIFFYYIIQQGEELICLHFLSGRVKLIVTSERLNIYKKQFYGLCFDLIRTVSYDLPYTTDAVLQVRYATIKCMFQVVCLPMLISIISIACLVGAFTVKDAEHVEDVHPFEAEEPKAITEFELLLTTRNKRKDGINFQ